MKIKNILFWLGLVYLNGIMYFAGYLILESVVGDELEWAADNTAQLKFDLESKQDKVFNLEAYKTQKEQLIMSLSSLIKKLPSFLSQDEIVAIVHTEALKFNLALERLDYQGEQNFEFYVEHALAIQLSGRYEDVINYLRELQTGDEIMISFRDFDLQAIDNGEVRFRAILNAYHYFDD